MLAVDMSNFTDPLSPTAIRGLKDAGVGHVIVQAIDPPPAYPAGRTRAQIQACLDAGLSVDAYVWLWFDLDANDIQRKLHLLDGLNVRQLWLDVEDTASVNYDQATCEAKVAAALAACDAYATTGSTRAGVYSGRWFWVDRRYMGNCTSFADRALWDANYDDVADSKMGYVPYGGWNAVTIKQFRGTTAIAGIAGLDLSVLSVELAAQLSAPVAQPPKSDPTPPDPPQTDQPPQSVPTPPDPPQTDQPPQSVPTPPDPPQTDQPPQSDPTHRQTPEDWQWSTWREAAIQYSSIADDLGQQLAAARDTPTGWQWPTWQEAAIQYKAIADSLGQQLAAASKTPPATSG
jgi:GH25 family lysozyme M1 (1,4-beta-N-acetylmuramidase)